MHVNRLSVVRFIHADMVKKKEKEQKGSGGYGVKSRHGLSHRYSISQISVNIFQECMDKCK